MSGGNMDQFENGLKGLIGHPVECDQLQEMIKEHLDYAYALLKEFEVETANYGIRVKMANELKHVLGDVTANGDMAIAENFMPPPGFAITRETKGVENDEEKKRLFIALPLYFPARLFQVDADGAHQGTTSPDESSGSGDGVQWGVDYYRMLKKCVDINMRGRAPGAPITHEKVRENIEEQLREARALIDKAKLTMAEVAAVRLWSGPAYEVYNNHVLRTGRKDTFTTTLHMLHSAIHKMARVGTPRKVYRGIARRAFDQSLFEKGYVEGGAQVCAAVYQSARLGKAWLPLHLVAAVAAVRVH